MKGTIRIIIGIIFLVGGIGGLDNLVPIIIPVLISIFGLSLMIWGQLAMSKSLD